MESLNNSLFVYLFVHMSSTLRIGPDNATIRELNIPKEKLEVLEKVVSSPQTTDDIKKLMIKKFAEVSPCCICGGIHRLKLFMM